MVLNAPCSNAKYLLVSAFFLDSASRSEILFIRLAINGSDVGEVTAGADAMPALSVGATEDGLLNEY